MKFPDSTLAPPRRGGRRGNAFVCLSFLPFWSVSYSLSFFYLSFYFREWGVSDSQLGLLVTVGAGASIVFSILAAPLVDRMGRRRATLVFDIAGTSIPFLLYAIRGDFPFALAGTVLSNSSRVMNVSYILLMSEDTAESEKSRAFNAFNIINIASGLLVPLAGGFVASRGIVAAERSILLASAILVALSTIGQYRFTEETATGKALSGRRPRSVRGARGNGKDPTLAPSCASFFSPYLSAFRFLRSSGPAAAVFAANVLFYVYFIVGTNNSLYFAPFFSDALGMDARLAGITGAVYSAGTLFAMVLVNPVLFRRVGPVRCGTFGAALNLAGFLPLVFLPGGKKLWAIGAVAVMSLGYGMLKSAIDAGLAACFGGAPPAQGSPETLPEGEKARSGTYAAANIASSVLGMGAGSLCGFFYPAAPRFIPVFSVLLLAAICPLLYFAKPRRQAFSSRRRS